MSCALNRSLVIQCFEHSESDVNGTHNRLFLNSIQDGHTYWYYEMCSLLTWPDPLLVRRCLECITWWNQCCCSLSWHTWGTLSQTVRLIILYHIPSSPSLTQLSVGCSTVNNIVHGDKLSRELLGQYYCVFRSHYCVRNALARNFC